MALIINETRIRNPKPKTIPKESRRVRIKNQIPLPLFIAGLVMLIIRTPEVDGEPRPVVTMKARRTLWNAITAREHRPVNREGSSDVPQM